jgi:hypothetical protein
VTGTFLSGAERAMQRSVAAFMALVVVSWSSTLISSRASLAPRTLVAGAVLVAVMLALLARAWSARLGRIDVGAACAVTVLMLAATAVDRADIVLGTRVTPSAVTAVLLGGLLSRGQAAVATTGLATVQVVAFLPMDGPTGVLAGLWPVIATAIAGAVCTEVMRSAAALADSAHSTLLMARAEQARAEGQRSANREFQRMLHDDVATALHAVDTAGVTPEEARHACAEAVAAAARVPVAPAKTDRDLLDVVRAFSSSLPLTTSADPHVGTRVPAPVADAMDAAAREALRNVERHARATSVQVHLTGDSAVVELEINDDGVGFADSGEHGPHRGLSMSVHERMDDVAGYVKVISAPGEGCLVRLGWRRPDPFPAPGHRSAAAFVELAAGDVRRPLAAVCLPFLLIQLIVAMAYTGASPGELWLLAWFVGNVILCLFLIRSANRPLGGRAALLSAAYGVLGGIGALLIIPRDSIDDFGSWPIGALTPLLVVLAALRPPWEALLAVTVQQTAVVSMVATGHFEADAPVVVLPAVLSPIFGVVMTITIMRTVLRLGRAAVEANDEQVAVTVAESTLEARSAIHARRVADLEGDVIPFLRRIANGPETEDRHGLSRRARVLETTIRDEMQLPGVIDAPTRQLLGSARSAGCVVMIQADADEIYPAAVLRALLAAALTGEDCPQRLTLSLFPDPGRLTVSLVVVPGLSGLPGRIRHLPPGPDILVEDSAEATEVRIVIQDVTISPEHESRPADVTRSIWRAPAPRAGHLESAKSRT